MSDAPTRVSEQRRAEAFSAVVLFDEHLQFRLVDIYEAFREDFSGLATLSEPMGKMALDIMDSKGIHDTANKVPMGTLILNTKDGSDEDVIVNIFSLTGGRYEDYDKDIDLITRNAFGFPGARKAWDDHAAYVYISARLKGDDLATRFRAARLISAVAAVFAGDENCTGVMFPTGKTIVSPEKWVEATNRAVSGSWPLEAWIGTMLFRSQADGRDLWQANSYGMAAFTGQEASFALAAVEPTFAHGYVQGALYQLLEAGHEYRDGDTIGIEGSGDVIRLRFMAESGSVQTDSWIMLHPDTAIDEMAVFGERPRSPPPPGVDNVVQEKPGLIGRLLRRGKSGLN